jgi:hypothetical protein
MKVQSGLSEYEAVKDFGDVKALADEMLEAYSIDPKYENEHESDNIKPGKRTNPILSICGKIKCGVSSFADFILTQKPKSLFIMFVKALVMAAVLFMLGCVGFVVATLADYAINDFIGIGDLLIYLYLIIAVPMAAFILFSYIIRLAHNKSGKVVTTSNTSTTVDFINILCGFAKKGFTVIFKIFVACILLMLFCALVFAVLFTAFALVFVVTGYPTTGMFIVGLGFCISCVAFMLIVSKGVFFGRRNI